MAFLWWARDHDTPLEIIDEKFITEALRADREGLFEPTPKPDELSSEQATIGDENNLGAGYPEIWAEDGETFFCTRRDQILTSRFCHEGFIEANRFAGMFAEDTVKNHPCSRCPQGAERRSLLGYGLPVSPDAGKTLSADPVLASLGYSRKPSTFTAKEGAILRQNIQQRTQEYWDQIRKWKIL